MSKKIIDRLMAQLKDNGVGCAAEASAKLAGRYHPPTVELVALESLLRAREAVGVKTYGRTLNDYPPATEEFWLRMAAEELADALMYIEKARGASELDLHGAAIGAVAEVLLVIMRDAYPREIERLTRNAVNTELFPPCKPEHA